MEKLLSYLNGLPKIARAEFVTRCGTSEGYLRKAASAGQKLSADLCIKIERESTGAIRCEDLRPTADWDYIRATAKTSKRRSPAPPP